MEVPRSDERLLAMTRALILVLNTLSLSPDT